jgi:hypothetical protein
MSPDPDDRTPAQASRDADASADMQQRLEQLDEHIDDASKKAESNRPAGSPKEGDPLDDVAGGGADNTEEVDDPEGPIVGGS